MSVNQEVFSKELDEFLDSCSTETIQEIIFHESLNRDRPLEQVMEACMFDQGGGTVYFIQMGEAGPTKIGFTNRDAKTRLSQLQHATPFPLYVRKAVKGTRRAERLFHYYFRPERIRGEWFLTSPKLSRLTGANETPDIEKIKS